MKWEKLGVIFCPDKEYPWLTTHASVPVAEPIDENILRIYFSSRDINGCSHVCYVDIDIRHPKEIINLSSKPLLSPGELGTFDDSGTMLTWIIHKDKHVRYFYYIGWNLGVTVPFRNSIGLAISKQDDALERYAKGPIVDRTTQEPHFVASCCVLKEDTGWKMWYLSCTSWEIILNKPRHRYHIKYAESEDGISWTRNGVVAIDFDSENEHAISRPCVLKEDGLYKMWYSYRGDSYRIGYAESLDGVHWNRLDQAVGIDVSTQGWDSEMIEYPYVFDYCGNRYMLYNGNGYGKTGFGLAILEEC